MGFQAVGATAAAPHHGVEGEGGWQGALLHVQAGDAAAATRRASHPGKGDIWTLALHAKHPGLHQRKGQERRRLRGGPHCTQRWQRGVESARHTRQHRPSARHAVQHHPSAAAGRCHTSSIARCRALFFTPACRT